MQGRCKIGDLFNGNYYGANGGCMMGYYYSYHCTTNLPFITIIELQRMMFLLSLLSQNQSFIKWTFNSSSFLSISQVKPLSYGTKAVACVWRGSVPGQAASALPGGEDPSEPELQQQDQRPGHCLAQINCAC